MFMDAAAEEVLSGVFLVLPLEEPVCVGGDDGVL
jgi:hypothetical protein